ncbi:hypothetical protein FRC00_010177 [Tulasnella sp. 408]|nr:hypothetical protein FRC00_010177 [Tulasnella sp. 408]
MDPVAAATSTQLAAPPAPPPPAQPSSSSNIWDSAWNACTQTPPPNLTEILAAYAQKGDGDREMLLGILKAKSAEDQRIAAVATLHQTILQLQAAALAAPALAAAGAVGAAAGVPPALTNGLSTPTPTPPVHSPPPPVQHMHHHHRSSREYPPPHHQASRPESPPGAARSITPTAYPSYYAATSSSSHPSLPPISTLQSASSATAYGGEEERSRKRSRVSSSGSSSSSHRRQSPDYPLSPYSQGSRRSPNQQSALPSVRSAPYPTANEREQRHPGGRLAVGSLLGAGHEEDGDVKYRRMSAERTTR